MRLLHRRGELWRKQIDVSREKQITGPFRHHAQLPVEAWQLQQIDRAPHHPGDESGKSHAKNFRHGAAVSDGREFAEAGELERLQRLVCEIRCDVVSDEQALTIRELRGLRAVAPVAFREHRAVTGGPHIGLALHEAGVFKGATIMLTTPPAFATVWNSNGGQATIVVTQKLLNLIEGQDSFGYKINTFHI